MSKNKVISASAGTGKTYRLSLEYLAALVLDKSLLPQEILVMTFTVKATAEIRQRVLEHLRAVSKDAELQKNLEKICAKKLLTEDLAHLEKMASWLRLHKDSFKIFTLDSFMQNFFYSLIAKELGLEQTSAINALPAQKKEEILNKIFLNPKLQLFFAETQSKDLFKYTKFVDDLLALNLQEFESIEIDFSGAKKKFLQELESLKLAAAQLKKVPAFPAKNIFLKPFCTFFESYLGKESNNFAEELENALQDDDFFLEAFLELKDKIWETSFFKKAKKNDLQELKNFRECFENFQPKLQKYLTENKLFLEHNRLLELAEQAQALYLKDSRQELTFSDFGRILQKNLYEDNRFLDEQKMLRAEFWQFLQVVPKVLMIDEFQDTSLVQFQNLLPIVKMVQSLDGSVITVGDSKQAIYAWRGGEQELLNKVGSYLPDCQNLVLDTCYRSCQNIIDFVNHLFSESYGKIWSYNPVNCALQKKGFVSLETSKSSNRKGKIEDEIESVVENTVLPILHDKTLDLSKMAIIARKNKELEIFSQILQKHKIPVYQKKSDSLLKHRAIKPFCLYLHFLGYDDFYSLFLFLKDAPLFLSGDEIAKILTDKEAIESFKLPESKNLFADFVKKFDYLNFFDTSDDLKNINAFAEILANQEQDILGILEFLRQREDSLSQKAGESKQAINLLTIHSCKGLEFDTVFYFLNCLARQNNSPEFRSFVQYSPDFSQVDKSLLTFHYPKLAKTLFEDVEAKEESEILNLAYVALTRAKSNLYLFANLNLKKVADGKKELNVWEKIAVNMQSFFAESEIDESDETYFSAYKNSPKFAQKSQGESFFSYDWKEENFAKSKDFQPIKSEEIDKKNALFGQMVHFYLSQIRWNSDAEKKLAKRMTLAKFGQKWRSYFDKIDQFLQANFWLYDKEKWGTILCEYPLFDGDKEFRLDRVMVSTDKRKATIVDYKTGSISDPEQLEIYKQIFGKMSGIAEIETVFLEVK